MRIAIDMQGVQSASRHRGIGRYSLSFAKAIARNRGPHEIFLLLSGLFPETIEEIRFAFRDLIGQENILVWWAPANVKACDPENLNRQEVGMLLRKSFVESLELDLIHITSLFEGFVDDAFTSVEKWDSQTYTSVSVYDLIPYCNPTQYLENNHYYSDFYKKKFEQLKKANIWLAISEHSRIEAIQHAGIPESMVHNVSTAIEIDFKKISISDDEQERVLRQYGINRQFLLYTGATDERKNLPRLIEAYSLIPTDLKLNYQLVIAGGVPHDHEYQLQRVARKFGVSPSELVFTGYVSDEVFLLLYNLCELYVFPSWHEGFGIPVLEAMSCGAPVICSNTTSLPEVVDLEEAMFNPFEVNSIADKITEVLRDHSLRDEIQHHGLLQAKKFSWDTTAIKAIQAWESLPATEKFESRAVINTPNGQFLKKLACSFKNSTDNDLLTVASCLDRNLSIVNPQKQLLVDVSELSTRDAGTGIQRVVRSILREWLLYPPTDYRLEFIYATTNEPYRYARKFTAKFTGENNHGLCDELIEVQAGDIFFALDYQPQIQAGKAPFYKYLRQSGVAVKFMVYDLLSITHAQFFPEGAREYFENWLNVVCENDGAVCISNSVADELINWMNGKSYKRLNPFDIKSNILGANIEKIFPNTLSKKNIDSDWLIPNKNPSFLMVGTLEPRKAHSEVLDAFDLIWAEGLDANLVIVGKVGWMTDRLANRVKSHPAFNIHLFWLDTVTDESLLRLYKSCSCLIAASFGEGFGLPIIEAAQHGLPVIARDIPVFREVAGDHALYFNSIQPEDLKATIESWLEMFNVDAHPKSNTIPWVTWKESAKQLLLKLNLNSINA